MWRRLQIWVLSKLLRRAHTQALREEPLQLHVSQQATRDALTRLQLTKNQYDIIESMFCAVEMLEMELRQRIKDREGEYLDLFLFMSPEQQAAWRTKQKNKMIEIAESRARQSQ